MSAGGDHTCVVMTDEKVVCFGDNSFGQTRVPAHLGAVKSLAEAASTLAPVGVGYREAFERRH